MVTRRDVGADRTAPDADSPLRREAAGLNLWPPSHAGRHPARRKRICVGRSDDWPGYKLDLIDAHVLDILGSTQDTSSENSEVQLEAGGEADKPHRWGVTIRIADPVVRQEAPEQVTTIIHLYGWSGCGRASCIPVIARKTTPFGAFTCSRYPPRGHDQCARPARIPNEHWAG